MHSILLKFKKSYWPVLLFWAVFRHLSLAYTDILVRAQKLNSPTEVKIKNTAHPLS